MYLDSWRYFLLFLSLKNLGASIVIRLEIAFISVSIELITSTSTKINKEILKATLLPLNGSSSREKKIVLGSVTLPMLTATIPKKPKINIKGITIKKADINPILRSLILFAAYTLCHIPWSNKFVAKTAIKKVIPAVYP